METLWRLKSAVKSAMKHFWKSVKEACVVEEKKTVTLDLTGCKYLGELHQRIKQAFDFPDFYGENWDAFWDLLWSECDADRVVVLGEHTVPEKLEPSILIMNKFLLEFKDYWAQYGDSVEIEIRG